MSFQHLFLISMLFISTALQSQNIKDIIQPIRITPGEETTLLLSDCFYAQDYDIAFEKNDLLDISYSTKDTTLTIKSAKDFSGIAVLTFTYNNQEYNIPILSKNLVEKTFTYKPEKDYEKLTLFGMFNSWNRDNLVMTDEDGDGIFSVTLMLEPGSYQYKFWGDGEELIDPNNPVRVPNGMGSENSLITIEDPHAGTNYLHVLGYNKNDETYSYSFYHETDSEKPLQADEIVCLLDNKLIDTDNIEINDNYITITLNQDELQNTKMLRIAVVKEGNVTNIQQLLLQNGEPTGYDDKTNTWYDTILYSIMIDRFFDGETTINSPAIHDSLAPRANYRGGDLQGIIQKINEGYFDELGINAIWISPVYDNPETAYREYPEPHRYFSGYHGYWPKHHKNVEENFGDFDKLKEFVAVSHKKNMRVLLDFVSNHVHQEHPFFHEHPEYFGELELPDGRLNLRFWDEYRLTTWFEPYLPSFNYPGSPEAIEVMTDNAVWWLKQTGADGLRHDAVKHVPFLFWRELTKKIKEEIAIPNNVDVYQIGETFGGYDLVSAYVNNGQLSSQFNFNLYGTAVPVFLDSVKTFKELDDDLQKTFDYYGVLNLMGNVMDSHDKARFMFFADGDYPLYQGDGPEVGWNDQPKVDNPENYKRAQLYYAYMFTIPGIPIIYYGSEFGMTGAGDPDNRRMMRFGDQLTSDEKTTLENTKAVAKLRNTFPALRYGDFLTILADETAFAYIRSDLRQRLLIVLHNADDSRELSLHIPECYKIREAIDTQTNEKVNLQDNTITAKMPKLSWKVFELR